LCNEKVESIKRFEARQPRGYVPMKVGLNLLFLRPGRVGGTETYSLGLIKAMLSESENEIVVFLNADAYDQGYLENLGVTRVRCPISGENQILRGIYEQMRFSVEIRRSKVEILHSLGYLGPVIVNLPHVVTIHDMNHRESTNKMPRYKRVFFSALMPMLIRNCQHILTVSNFSANALMQCYKLRSSKITVTYNAAVAPKSCGQPRTNWPEYFLLAGPSSAHHKNIETVIQAFKQVLISAPTLRLVVFGPSGAYSGNLMNFARNQGVAERVIFTGYVSASELYWLYSNACAFAFPSLYEGFGIPVIEAMQAGCPVIASPCGALREIVGTAGVIVENPYDFDRFASEIMKVLQDQAQRERLKTAGLHRAAQFTWATSAKLTLGVYDRLLDNYTTRMYQDHS